jgi:hypothetical protein
VPCGTMGCGVLGAFKRRPGMVTGSERTRAEEPMKDEGFWGFEIGIRHKKTREAELLED